MDDNDQNLTTESNNDVQQNQNTQPEPSLTGANEHTPLLKKASFSPDINHNDIQIDKHQSEKKIGNNRFEPQLVRIFGLRPRADLMDKSTAHEFREKHAQETGKASSVAVLWIGNTMWAIFFGWWLALIYLLISLPFFVSVVGIRYGKFAVEMAGYVLWPFQKYLYNEDKISDKDKGKLDIKSSAFSPSFTVGFAFWCVFASVAALAHLFVWAITWMLVVSIPMAEVNLKIVKSLFSNPKHTHVSSTYPGAHTQVLIFHYQSVNLSYYEHDVGGFNVCLVNLFPFVLIGLFLGYIFPLIDPSTEISPVVMFLIMLASIIPLSYYIGLAIASIAAQTNAAIGSFLNATFGSIVELILYFFAISKGLQELVTGSIIGSLLAMMLLLPGLAMIFGGIKHREQKFNYTSTQVSAVLLIVSIIGAFIPTIYYHTYGNHSLRCNSCHLFENANISCGGCHYDQFENFDSDKIYREGARPLMYAISVVLPLSYALGMLFVLRTHTDYLYKTDDEHEGGGHEGPDWSLRKCFLILIACTVLLALIAEKLVNVLEPTLKIIGLKESFVGVTVVALVPSTAELVNSIKFAMEDNIALSMEVGSAYAVQTALIQIPALVIFSAIFNHFSSQGSFILIFDQLSLFAVIFSVITFNYISIDPSANYFQGTALTLIYIIFVIAFYFSSVVPGFGSEEGADTLVF